MNSGQSGAALQCCAFRNALHYAACVNKGVKVRAYERGVSTNPYRVGQAEVEVADRGLRRLSAADARLPHEGDAPHGLLVAVAHPHDHR